MLRVILGGIAGVATGYAIKKYLDEVECSQFDFNKYDHANMNNVSNEHDEELEMDILKPLNDIKQKLNATLFRETGELIRSIKNMSPMDGEEVMDEYSGVDYLMGSPMNHQIIMSFCAILNRAEEAQTTLLQILAYPLSNIDDLNQLEGDNKLKAIDIVETDTLMREAYRIAVTLDGKNVSIVASRKYNQLLSNLEKEKNYSIMSVL